MNKKRLDQLYNQYNRREFVHPDPLEFLYNYKDVRDREIAGLVASSLAYGRVAQILKSVSCVLEHMDSPANFLQRASRKLLLKTFADFRHRFTTGKDVSMMLFSIKSVVEQYGSLHHCFTASLNKDDETILPALSAFVERLTAGSDVCRNSLLPLPAGGSACKRLNLFLRWMVRRDDVDPGGWDDVPASKLIIPLDTHMHRISLALGLTKRRQPDMRTASEITAAFKTIICHDPVKYDFALTRLGIRKETDMEAFLWPDKK
ncbi:MAG: TIGR02757 family protein [Thermodesulfobacteriota bacterium]|nr:TIGR02757 family protein [Thermodesulfobacteriota bacterium]